VTPDSQTWQVRLTTAARADYRDVLRWTAEHFGELQATRYQEMLDDALRGLSGGPSIPGVRRRDDLDPGVLLLHVSRGTRKGRHLIAFAVERVGDHQAIVVLRILHDAMDLARHLGLQGEWNG
jgi:toxin ParE1/3/4